MKTDEELEKAVTNIVHRHRNHLFRDALPHSIKELRSIEIAALREALEAVATINTDPERPGWRVVEDVAHTTKELERKIRDLELK